MTDKRFHSNLAIAPTCDTVSTYHITDDARDPQRGLSRATYIPAQSQSLGSGAQRGGVLTSFTRPTVLAEGDLHPSHGHGSMTGQEGWQRTAALHEDFAHCTCGLDSCDRRASVATVETELVARAPSQLRRPRGSPFRPRACLCASIAIFRIAPSSLERARSAQTPLRP